MALAGGMTQALVFQVVNGHLNVVAKHSAYPIDYCEPMETDEEMQAVKDKLKTGERVIIQGGRAMRVWKIGRENTWNQ
jgi:antitoxin component of RelBE/YafQ-DinJ toxin-antitoxin module